tara:strand:- start:182 stop:433 length:252 start_codon:yes stop_codon:yes gene_type:complete
MESENLTYSIISLSDLSLIDFSQIHETSSETIRKNLTDPSTQFLIKYEEIPSFIASGEVTPISVLNYSECLTLLATSDWTTPI